MHLVLFIIPRREGISDPVSTDRIMVIAESLCYVPPISVLMQGQLGGYNRKLVKYNLKAPP